MGQIEAEKNADGIEGLCVIEPTVHGNTSTTISRLKESI